MIAITGSNGKTSTKDILHGLLTSHFGEEKVYTTKANTNNLIGVPQNILNITSNHILAVIELGSNHPGEIKELTDIANPDIAVITSIGPAHLEFFKDINGVIKEKSSIFTAFKNPKTGVAILPVEYKNDELIGSRIKNLKVITFGKEKKADIQYKHLSSAVNNTTFELHWQSGSNTISWNISGKHQIANAAAAAAAATVVNISPQEISSALTKCKIITGMRMSIKEVNGITWINDAYNSNPSSAKAGIDWLHEISKTSYPNKFKRIIVVLGDMRELGTNSFSENKELVEYAFSKLPFAQIYGVGSIMCKVGSEQLAMGGSPRSDGHTDGHGRTRTNTDNNDNPWRHLPHPCQSASVRVCPCVVSPRTTNHESVNPESNIQHPTSDIHSFPNSDEAASFFSKELKSGDLVYLKGSRGIALEKIENLINK